MSLSHSLVRLGAAALPSVLAAFVVGCAPVDEVQSDGQIGFYKQSIKGGYTDRTDTGVVVIYDASIGALCSGSLVAPNVILTARHCVSDVSEQVECGRAKPGAMHDAKNFYVSTLANVDSQSPSGFHRVSKVVGLPLDPSSTDPILNKEDLCGRDQAALILSDNISPADATPWIPRVDSALATGEQYYAVGYGATDGEGNQAGIRRRRDNLSVACVGDECPAVYVKGSEFIGETGICSGDSGGPAIDMQNRVVGVTSRGDEGCESPIYGQVFSWGQWLKDVVNDASQPDVGNYPAPPWASGKSTDPAFGGAVGGPCDAVECTSGICIDSGADQGEYCSHKCDEINTCPDGFECSADSADSADSVCVEKPKPVEPPPSVPTSGGDTSKSSAGSEGGCSVQLSDPTKPVPWHSGVLLLGAVAVLTSRRRR